MESYASMAPEALDRLLPEERHQVYKMLGLTAMFIIIDPLDKRLKWPSRTGSACEVLLAAT